MGDRLPQPLIDKLCRAQCIRLIPPPANEVYHHALPPVTASACLSTVLMSAAVLAVRSTRNSQGEQKAKNGLENSIRRTSLLDVGRGQKLVIKIIKAEERYRFQNDWLSTYWLFSFDHYYDPTNISWGKLRVFNDDIVGPGRGFGLHPHSDMEIITYLLEGELLHEDNAGNRGVLRAGYLQRMTAGTGIAHSEYNYSKTSPLHLYQIWIEPKERGLKPSWQQTDIGKVEREEVLLPVVTPDGKNGSVKIHQDATIYLSSMKPGSKIAHNSKDHFFLYVTSGEVKLNGNSLAAGDQAKVSKEGKIVLDATKPSELIAIETI